MKKPKKLTERERKMLDEIIDVCESETDRDGCWLNSRDETFFKVEEVYLAARRSR